MIRKSIVLLLLIPVLAFAADQNLDDSRLVLLKNDSPLIAIRILFQTGSAHDPKGKEGLAALTASMLAEAGTTKNEYQKILQLLFPLAASYNATVDKEMTVLYGVTHKDNLDAYYGLIRDAVLSPAFRETDFQRLKAEQLNYVTKTLRYNNDEELGRAILYGEIYKNHPYGHPTAGLASSLNSITIQDVKDFYRSNYGKSNLWIGVAGDFHDSLIPQIKKDFAVLPAGKQEMSKLPQTQPISEMQAVLVEKETPATAISFGFPITITRSDPDYYLLLIANSWLGQHRNQFSHLFNVMREARGLNYGDYSYIEYFPFPGQTMEPLPNFARRQHSFEVWIRPVQNQNRHFALRQAVRELQLLIENGMSRQDFELAQNFVKNYTVSLAQSVSHQLGYALDDRFYDLHEPFLQLVRERVDSATLEQVNHALKKHLRATNFIVAAVTSKAIEYKKVLAENAPSPIKYESPKPESILKEDQEIMKFPLPLNSENIRIVPVEKTFE